MGKQAKINSAQMKTSGGGGEVRQAARTGNVGNESKADMRGAGVTGGNDMGQKGLSGAVKELARQHPIKYDDCGPHHGRRK